MIRPEYLLIVLFEGTGKHKFISEQDFKALKTDKEIELENKMYEIKSRWEMGIDFFHSDTCIMIIEVKK